MIINSSLVFAQNVSEVKPIELSEEFNETIARAIQYKDSTIYKKIENFENGLSLVKSKYEKYLLIFNNLGPYYASTEQFDKAIDVWVAANKEDIFFPFEVKKNKVWPPYLSNFANSKRFDNFIIVNDSLRKVTALNSKAEYFVKLPDNYDAQKKYPLIIILHGGSGDNNSLVERWNSETIRNNFISVYPHGRNAQGSFAYRYGSSGVKDMKEIYNQVISNYPIDTSIVILGGQSNGGKMSIQLAYNEIPVCGLFLAFPTIPKDFDYNKAFGFKNRNTRVVIVSGEKDRFYPGQQKLTKALDSAKVELRFRKYPDLGHNFPKDFTEQLNAGLIYLMTK